MSFFGKEYLPSNNHEYGKSINSDRKLCIVETCVRPDVYPIRLERLSAATFV
ncbi:Protein of unknown function [Lactobacillus helveticus CIRM-BIA 101]|nr:Protein of unknown function [Lactobacillus helveticus CIRM-BIA 101]